MKITGFADTGIVKELVREAGYTVSSIRRVIATQSHLDLFFHNGDKMVRLPIEVKLNKERKK